MVIMMTKKYELRLNSNGVYYFYENRILKPDISFDKSNKDSAKELVSLLNEQNKEIVALKCKIDAICTILQVEKCGDVE